MKHNIILCRRNRNVMLYRRKYNVDSYIINQCTPLQKESHSPRRSEIRSSRLRQQEDVLRQPPQCGRHNGLGWWRLIGRQYSVASNGNAPCELHISGRPGWPWRGPGWPWEDPGAVADTQINQSLFARFKFLLTFIRSSSDMNRRVLEVI